MENFTCMSIRIKIDLIILNKKLIRQITTLNDVAIIKVDKLNLRQVLNELHKFIIQFRTVAC